MPFPYPETHTSADATAPNRIDTVLFDYGLVLSGQPDPAAWDVVRSITGLDQDTLHAAYWHFRHDYDRGVLTGNTYWHAVADHAGMILTDAQVAALLAVDVDLWTVPNQPMIDWAARLQRAGMRTGILSNIGDAIAQGIVARLPWLAGFNHCTWSYALRTAKPDPAIYLKTAEALQADPTRTLFIDDRRENVDAAAALGFHAIQYTTHSVFEQEMHDRGFASLLEVQLLAAPLPAAK